MLVPVTVTLSMLNQSEPDALPDSSRLILIERVPEMLVRIVRMSYCHGETSENGTVSVLLSVFVIVSFHVRVLKLSAMPKVPFSATISRTASELSARKAEKAATKRTARHANTGAMNLFFMSQMILIYGFGRA